MTSRPGTKTSILCALALAFTMTVAAQAQVDLTLTKSFAPTTIPVGGTSLLTFTIKNNTSAYHSGIQFSDTLPPGLTLTNPMIVGQNSCYFPVTSTGSSTINVTFGSVSSLSTCVLSVAVTSSTSNVYNNTTSTLTWSYPSSGTSPAASASLTVGASPPGVPVFSKSFSPATIYEETGAPSTLTFTIDNSAVAADATSLAFTDTLPSGLMVANPTGVSSSCGGSFTPALSPGDTSLTFGSGSVAAGQTCTVQVNVTPVYSDFTGTLDNLSGDLNSSLGDSGVATARLSVAWLEIQKTFLTNPVAPGGTSTLEFTITNHDTYSSADYVGFTDDLNAALSGMTATALPANGFCGSGSTITGTSTLTMNNNGTVGADSSCTFDVTVQIPANAAPGTYTNTTSTIYSLIGGEVDSPSGAPASADLVVAPPVTWSKSFTPASITLGQSSTLSITIDNTAGSLAASSIAFTDPLPPGMAVANPAGASSSCGGTFAPAAGDTSLSFSGGSVAAGTTCTISVDVVASKSGNLVNTTDALSASTGPAAPVSATLAVTAPVIAIPTLNLWALIALAGLLLLSAAWFLKR